MDPTNQENPMNDDAVHIHDGTLNCPACGSQFTHIDEVHAITREGEDAKPKAVVLYSSGQVDGPSPVETDSDTGRRHEFTLWGWCEDCDATWFITFRQHKGQTLVGLRIGGGPST